MLHQIMALLLLQATGAKFKTAFQMITIIMLVLNLNVPFMNIINTVLIYISLGLTVISLIDYIAKEL